MALSLAEQFRVGMDSIKAGDVDLLAKALTTPDAITPVEFRNMAEKLGLKKGFLSAAVNTFSDPVVLLSFLMSMKFPAHAISKGVIEQRFWGMAKDFGGISKVANHVNGIFTNTLIPKMNGLVRLRRAKFQKLAKIYEDMTDTPTWQADRGLVVRVLEGEVPAGALKRHHVMAGRMRKEILDPTWELLQKSQHIIGGDDIRGNPSRPEAMSMAEAHKRGIRGVPAPKYLRNWVAHLPLHANKKTGMIDLDPRAVINDWNNNKMIRDIQGTRGVKHPFKMENGQVVSNKADFDRFWVAQDNTVWNQQLFPRKRDAHISGGLFETNLDYIMDVVLSSAARTYSLNAPLTAIERQMVSARVRGADGVVRTIRATEAPPIVQIITDGLKASVGKGGEIKWITREVKGTGYTDRDGIVHSPKTVFTVPPGQRNNAGISSLDWMVKGLRGQASDQSLVIGSLYNPIREQIYRMTSKIGLTKANELDAQLSNEARQLSLRRSTTFATSYLYRSILGLNPWSAMQNALQTPLTIYPSLGFGNTIAGMMETAKRTKGFVAGMSSAYRTLPPHIKGTDRIRRSMVDSMQKNWPELADLAGSRTLFELDPQTMERMGKIQQGKFAKGLDGFLDAIMLPFMGVEFANRSNAYYGRINQIRVGLRTGEYPVPKLDGVPLKGFELKKILDFEGKQFVDESQFIPSAGSKSVAQYNLDPLERMFQGFPLRFFNYHANATTKGALSNAEMQSYRSIKGFYEQLQKEKLLVVPGLLSSLMGGRNLGVLARGYIGGQLLVNTFRDVAGVDLQRSLGLLTPFDVPDSQPFAPLPMPPVMGTTLATVSSFSNRDIKRMQPMILPGGKMLPVPKTLLPGGIGVSRMFRAMNQFRPDVGGFVDENEKLMYRGGQTDLILRMLGVPLEKARHERQIMERMKANRGRIRQHRRDFVNAASNADITKMDSIRAQWKKEFPDMPPINVTKGDMKLYGANRQRTRVERMMRTLPRGFQYIRRDLYDVEPDLWSTPPAMAF